MTKWL